MDWLKGLKKNQTFAELYDGGGMMKLPYPYQLPGSESPGERKLFSDSFGKRISKEKP